MFLVDEKMGAAAMDEDDELLLVFWRLGGGEVAALLVPGLFPVSLVAMVSIAGLPKKLPTTIKQDPEAELIFHKTKELQVKSEPEVEF